MTFLSHLRASWILSLFGCILYAASFVILFWNEGRQVTTTLSLEEALSEAISVRHDSAPADKSLEGKLIHLSGPLSTGEPLTELDYNIMVQAVKLRRRVQMFQWIEETVEHNYGESVASVQSEERTYYYTTEWKDSLIDTRSFYIRNGHHNPTSFPIESAIFVADTVKIGPYELSMAIKDRFDDFTEVTSDTRPEDPAIKLHSGMYYHCDDLFNPEVGDVRLQFLYAGLQGDTYTVVGRLENGKIVPHRTKMGKKVLLLYKGDFSLAEAFRQEHHSQRLVTWGFRLVGTILLFFAVTCTSTLLTILLTKNRFTAYFAPNPENLFSSNLGFTLSTALCITSIAWIIHRPLLGAGLLITASSPILYCGRNAFRYQRMD